MEQTKEMQPRILIVDDEDRFRKTLSKLLKAQGLTVNDVGSGEEALRFIENHPVDIILLDMRMAGMNGIETLSAIKKRDPLIEVIILTGHASVDVAVEIMKLGGYEYLLKPCDIDELTVKIDGAFERRMTRLKHAKQSQDKGSLD
ncbi:MAG: response regulator [Syntrophobacterales bacterium]|nr:response regulator [Syntrophobacterales bacterium]